MDCQKLTYKNKLRVLRGGLAEWEKQNTEKDPGPPICDDVFCGTGGNIDSGSLPENDIYFFHPDHLGSTSYITNIAGETVQFNTYMPFGESFVSQQRFGVVSQYTFLSKEKDTETGLHYLSARYYNSQLSVFLSIDPLWEQTGDPYGYSYRNPIKYIDPSGLGPETYIVNEETGDFTFINDGSNDIVVMSSQDYNLALETGSEVYGTGADGTGNSDPITGGMYYGALDRGDRITPNEFGMIQITSLGNPGIKNNSGSEDVYSFLNKNGSRSNYGQHGDDWAKPEIALAFSKSVYQLRNSEPNQSITLNDASGYNAKNNKPFYNLKHSINGGHSSGESFDMRFLNTSGTGSNDINSLSNRDINLNAKFINILKNNGFTTFYTDGGRIPGSKHSDGHDNHLHGGMK